MAQPAAGAAPRAGSITVCNTLEPLQAQRSPSDVHSKQRLGMDACITLVTHPCQLEETTSQRGAGTGSHRAPHLPAKVKPRAPQSDWMGFTTVSASLLHALQTNMSWPGRGRKGRALSLSGAEEPEQAEAEGAEAGAGAAPSCAATLDAALPIVGKCSLLSNGSAERSLEAPGSAWRASYPKPCSVALQDTSFQAGSPHGSRAALMEALQ